MNSLYTRIRNNNQTSRFIKWLITAGDFIVLWILLFLTTGNIPHADAWNNDKVHLFWMVCTFALIVAEYSFPTVVHQRTVGANDILRRCTLLVLTQTLLSYILLRAIHFMAHVGWHLLYIGLLMMAAIILLRFVERWLLKRFRRLGHNTRTITLVGSDKELQRLYDKLINNPALGYKVRNSFGLADFPHHNGSVSDFSSMLEHPENLRLGDEVYLCVSSRERDLIERTVRLCDHRMVKFYLVPIAKEKLNLQPLLVDDISVLTTYSSPLEEPLNMALKRLADIILSMLFLLPTILILPFIALVVKKQSPGPVFFRQQRTGLDGRNFCCLKFRSMHVNDDADRVQATREDSRKFPFGNFMRKTNIDELPQFWNVLRGDMSIVGPRPHMLAHTEQYNKLIDKYMVRHFVKPGITGWAQVTGFRGETSELWQMEGRIERDIWYIQHWSLWLDLRIIWMTFKSFLKGDKKAY